MNYVYITGYSKDYNYVCVDKYGNAKDMRLPLKNKK